MSIHKSLSYSSEYSSKTTLKSFPTNEYCFFKGRENPTIHFWHSEGFKDASESDRGNAQELLRRQPGKRRPSSRSKAWAPETGRPWTPTGAPGLGGPAQLRSHGSPHAPQARHSGHYLPHQLLPSCSPVRSCPPVRVP